MKTGMPPRIAASLIAILCMAVMPVSAQDGADDAASRVVILGLERAWSQAYKDGDAKAIVNMFDDSLIMIEGDGSIKNKVQYMATVHKHDPRQAEASIESINVTVYSKMAVAVGQLAVKGKAGVHRERFIDTWTNKNGAWVLVASDSTPILH